MIWISAITCIRITRTALRYFDLISHSTYDNVNGIWTVNELFILQRYIEEKGVDLGDISKTYIGTSADKLGDHRKYGYH